jgi:hypothetical protein
MMATRETGMATRDFLRQRSHIKTGVEPARYPAEDREVTTDPGMETAVGATDPAADGTLVASAVTSGTAGGPGSGPGRGGRPRPTPAPVQNRLTC